MEGQKKDLNHIKKCTVWLHRFVFTSLICPFERNFCGKGVNIFPPRGLEGSFEQEAFKESRKKKKRGCYFLSLSPTIRKNNFEHADLSTEITSKRKRSWLQGCAQHSADWDRPELTRLTVILHSTMTVSSCSGSCAGRTSWPESVHSREGLTKESGKVHQVKFKLVSLIPSNIDNRENNIHAEWPQVIAQYYSWPQFVWRSAQGGSLEAVAMSRGYSGYYSGLCLLRHFCIPWQLRLCLGVSLQSEATVNDSPLSVPSAEIFSSWSSSTASASPWIWATLLGPQWSRFLSLRKWTRSWCGKYSAPNFPIWALVLGRKIALIARRKNNVYISLISSLFLFCSYPQIYFSGEYFGLCLITGS